MSQLNRNVFSVLTRNKATLAHPLLVIGAGSGGIGFINNFIAKAANKAIGLKYGEIGIVEPSQMHYYQPGFTLVGGGLEKVENLKRTTGSLIPKSVTHYPNAVSIIDPDSKKVILNDGTEIYYELLVVAAGLQIDWNKVKGLKDAIGHDGVCTNYSHLYTSSTYRFIQQTKAGNAIFTFPNTPVKCAGAPQKIMYLADWNWRESKVRDHINIDFVTAGAALFSVKKYADALNKICDERDLHRTYGLNLIEIKPESKEAIFEVNPAINQDIKEKLKVMNYDFIHVTPPMGAPDFLKNSPSLIDASGFLTVDKETLQHTKYPNIFAIGDNANLPTSKTLAALATQLPVVRENIVSFAFNKPLTAKYTGYTSCPITTDGERVILAEFDYTLEPKETFSFDQAVPSKFNMVVKRIMLPLYYIAYVRGLWEGPSQLSWLRWLL